MATIAYIDDTVTNGNELLDAVRLIRRGIGKLAELDGVRAEAIADAQATMASIFGVDSSANAQIVSDRWAAFLAAYDDSGNSEMGKLRDLLNATVAS